MTANPPTNLPSHLKRVVIDNGGHTCKVGFAGQSDPERCLLNGVVKTKGPTGKVYVGDQATASSKVYARLQERLNVCDHVAVLGVFVSKIVANLQLRPQCHKVNEKSLALFSDLAGGYCSGKLLLKLDAVHYLLRHHTADDVAFLHADGNVRLRTVYYSTLCKLLFLDEASIKFKAFIEPLTRIFRFALLALRLVLCCFLWLLLTDAKTP